MRAALLAAAALGAAPVAAQDHSAHGGHSSEAQGHAGHGDVATPPEMDHCAMGHLPPEQCPSPEQDDEGGDTEPMDHSQMDHSGMEQPDDSHSGMVHSAMDHAPADKSAPGAAPESAVPPRALQGPQHAADAVWGAEAMAPAREANRATHGGMKTGMVMVERLEARIAEGHDAFVWDAQAWYGGDLDKMWLKTEGEGEFGGAVEDAEIQALWSHAIGPFFDLQAGARLDLEPETRSHLVLGVQGLAPYMFHVDGAVFLSDRGDIAARLEGEYDQKITQRLILQPRAELELAVQDVPERGIGGGLTTFETGLRLRYEIAREFAPYIGVGYEAKLGETADIARAAGEDPDGFALLLGVRAWF